MYEKALIFATSAHAGMTRKYTHVPYITHPVRVAEILRDVGFDEVVIVAALLHDTVEDTATTLLDIEAEFGPVVARYVDGLTEVTTLADGNRVTRKAIERERLAKKEAEVHAIKLADIIDNAATIVMHDPKFAKVYMREKKDLVEVLTKGHPVLLAKAKAIIEDYYHKRG